MRDDHYAPGTVTALLETDHVTAPTRQILLERLAQNPAAAPRFFDGTAFELLRIVRARLIPQPHPARCIDLAGLLDTQLLESPGKGWRYDSLPPDDQAFRVGLQGIHETSVEMFAQPFTALNEREQIAVLTAVQKGLAPGAIWQQLPANRFFEELLAALVVIYYAHPWSQEDIGVVAMADKQGWHSIGLDELETIEPVALNKRTHDTAGKF